MKQTQIIIFFLLTILIGCSIKEEKKIKNECISKANVSNVLDECKKSELPLKEISFSQPINPEYLQNDLAILRYVLEEANTSLYRYESKLSVDSLFDAKICELKEPTTYLDFVRDVSEIFTFIACGHSGWSHAPNYKQYRNDSTTFFPLKIYAFENQYYIRENGSLNTEIKEGDEILTINGTAPADINVKLSHHMVKDGKSAQDGRSGISQYFKMAYSNFIGNPDQFNLVCKRSDSKEIYEATIDALKLNMIDSIINTRYPSSKTASLPLKMEIHSDLGVGIYSIKSFRNEYIEALGQNFLTVTDSVFEALKSNNINHLIIDLRNNGGGWTANGRYLYSYLANYPSKYINSVEFNKIDSFSFEPIILRGNGIEDTMTFKLNDNHLYEWTNYHVLDVEPKNENRFKGQVYVLINDYSHSCSVMFSSMMKSHTNAIFIGEETGGAQCGSNGMVMGIQLPYSGINIGLSTAKYTLNVENRNDSRGIIPDHIIKTTWKDFDSGKDSQMEFALDIIKSHKN